MNGRPRTYTLIAGGGTAGHVLPAISVARALVDRGHDAATIRFVGSKRGMEATLVPEAGFAVTLLPGRGIERRFTAANLGAIAGLVLAAARALVLVIRVRPAVVVTVGGYASVPSSLAAALCRVPLVVVNVDAVPGAANRLAARFARAVAVALPGTGIRRAVVTGAPVREEILAADRAPAGRERARRELGLPPGRRIVAVSSGSLGARRVNDAVAGLAQMWRGRDDLAVYHVVGRRDFEAVRQAAGALAQLGSSDGPLRTDTVRSGLFYRIVAYEPSMPALLAACDIAVCRAGASTVAELTAIGVPSILVPLPGAPGDHQNANASVLADAGAAVILPDGQCSRDMLAAELDGLLGDRQALETMAVRASSLGRRDASEAVARLVEEHAAA